MRNLSSEACKVLLSETAAAFGGENYLKKLLNFRVKTNVEDSGKGGDQWAGGGGDCRKATVALTDPRPS